MVVDGDAIRLAAEGELALADGRWEEARQAFRAAVSSAESPETLDGLARASWWLGQTEEAVSMRERAYSGFKANGDITRAVRAALWLSQEYGAVVGRDAVANGWLERAASLLGNKPVSTDHGWLALIRAGRTTEPTVMEDSSRLALAIARDHGDTDLEVRALARLGLALATRGEVEEGFNHMDEAMVAATGEASVSLEAIGETFCDGFALMEMVGDSDRLGQWSGVMRRYMQQHDYGPLVAFCGTCCGELFIGSGDLDAAERELVTALRKLGATSSRARCAHPAAKLAELRLLQGRNEEAARLLDGYRGLPETAFVEASLALADNKPSVAIALLDRHITSIDGTYSLLSARYLVLLVSAHLAARDIDAARAASDRLALVAAASAVRRTEAESLKTAAHVALAAGDPAAGTLLERSLRLFTTLQLPLEAARVRVLMAESVSSSNPELAEAEARAAYAAFAQIGARRDADAAAAVLRRLGATGVPGPRGEGTLTRRESEVLGLLAEGLRNAEIAERLFISAKTVDHHVSRILTKLGVRNRSEAAAYAVRNAAG